jgi:alkylation response protein AidB-like acyl-CoA dehydrogenase
MDFAETPQEAEFRAEARTWLDEHAPRYASDFAKNDDALHVATSKAWQRELYDGGWAGITWPVEYGGRGGTSIEHGIFDQEQAQYGLNTGVFAVGIGMTGPTLIAHGTPEQKQRFLEPLLRGDEVWCQLFSEPGAGSDLAGLSTKAERDGDEFVINGQKVWTSGAHHSDWGILLARTNPDAPKHRGITYFLLDMSTPGIEVRPVRQINGASHFNEVFLTDVRVPIANVVGAVDDGWRAVLTTLSNERTLIGGMSQSKFDPLLDAARTFGRASDPVVRHELTNAYIRERVLEFLRLRARTARSRGLPPGPESSVMKLAISKHLEESGNLGVAILGPEGTLSNGDAHAGGALQHAFLSQWASRIGGGTEQVQRNIVGERVLGLPGDIRVDKGVPFNQLSRSTTAR